MCNYIIQVVSILLNFWLLDRLIIEKMVLKSSPVMVDSLISRHCFGNICFTYAEDMSLNAD